MQREPIARFGLSAWRTQARRLGRLAVVAALMCTASAWAATVTYTATDLADVTPGEDLWQYSYTVKGPLPEFNSINLLFSPALYSGLNLVGNSQPADIDVLITEPDAGLGVDGQSTVLALSNLVAGFEAVVDVSFVWLGTGAPGAQQYQILDDQFNEVGAGTTRPTPDGTVPEPGALPLTLLALGLAGLMLRRAAK